MQQNMSLSQQPLADRSDYMLGDNIAGDMFCDPQDEADLDPSYAVTTTEGPFENAFPAGFTGDLFSSDEESSYAISFPAEDTGHLFSSDEESAAPLNNKPTAPGMPMRTNEDMFAPPGPSDEQRPRRYGDPSGSMANTTGRRLDRNGFPIGIPAPAGGWGALVAAGNQRRRTVFFPWVSTGPWEGYGKNKRPAGDPKERIEKNTKRFLKAAAKRPVASAEDLRLYGSGSRIPEVVEVESSEDNDSGGDNNTIFGSDVSEDSAEESDGVWV
jgi:hypothetical protein